MPIKAICTSRQKQQLESPAVSVSLAVDVVCVLGLFVMDITEGLQSEVERWIYIATPWKKPHLLNHSCQGLSGICPIGETEDGDLLTIDL
jgi:hypothetical protein